MEKIINIIEYIIRIFIIKYKIVYWKLKYGKRIKIGKKLRFRKGFIINISKEGYLEIGDNNFFNNYCSINCHKYIKICNNNLFGEGVRIYDHNHIFNDTKVNIKEEFSCHEINIGNYNWIGSGCIVLSKTELGNRNVIGAGVVLNKQYKDKALVKSNKPIEEIINFKE